MRGRTLTSWPSLRTDIRNAGGTWVDRDVVDDEGLISSRKPDDLPAFCKQFVDSFSRNGTPPWAEHVQGIAHDSGHWFVTQEDRLWRIPVDLDLERATTEHPKVAAVGIPAS